VLAESDPKMARRRGPGRPFPPGQSGNPGGRPKGTKTFSVLRIIAEALSNPATQAEAIRQLREALTHRKTVLAALEFAARVNKEVGLRADGRRAGGVTILMRTNIRPERLRASIEARRALEEREG